jgi:hypothetical protein
LPEILEIDLSYEVDMLITTFARLEQGGTGDQILNNALIESFCIHARGLIDFFNGAKGSPVQSFVDGNYVAFPRGQPRGDLIKKINTQIAHLTSDRRSRDKIDVADRRELLVVLRAEVQNFSRHLKPEFSSGWKWGDAEPNQP